MPEEFLYNYGKSDIFTKTLSVFQITARYKTDYGLNGSMYLLDNVSSPEN